MQPPFGLGALPSPEAEKLTAWTAASVGAPTAYPEAVFIEKVLELFITNQGKIGSCVGNTYEEIVRLIQLLLGNEQVQLSWRFVYAACKAIEGRKVTLADGSVIDGTIFPRTAGANDGTYMALAAIVVRKIGVPTAEVCPNDINLSPDDFCYGRVFANLPSAALADARTRHAGADVTFPVSEDGIMQALVYAKANNGGVSICRSIGQEYWMHDGVPTYDAAKLLPIQPPKAIVSGHDELLYGSDIDHATGRRRIFWQNHWDKDWCSTNGNSQDGGRAWEYLDVWLPFIKEIRVTVPALPPAPSTFTYTFGKDLSLGMKGPDVVALQHALDLEGVYAYNPTDGSPKYTGNFKDMTLAAVKAFQQKYASEVLTPLGLKAPTGYVGPATRKKLNQLFAPK